MSALRLVGQHHAAAFMCHFLQRLINLLHPNVDFLLNKKFQKFEIIYLHFGLKNWKILVQRKIEF